MRLFPEHSTVLVVLSRNHRIWRFSIFILLSNLFVILDIIFSLIQVFLLWECCTILVKIWSLSVFWKGKIFYFTIDSSKWCPSTITKKAAVWQTIDFFHILQELAYSIKTSLLRKFERQSKFLHFSDIFLVHISLSILRSFWSVAWRW